MIVDPAEIDRVRRYHLLISAVVPRPIAWTTTRSADGRVNLAPFSFFQGVGSAPPSLMLSFGSRRDGTPKDTCRNILDTGEFVVNVVTEARLRVMVGSSAEYPPEVSEPERLGLELAPSQKVAPPRLAVSPVSLECRLLRHLKIGGSTVVFGEIVLFHVDDAVVDERGTIDPRKLRPAARLGGNLYTGLGPVVSVPRPRLD